MHYAVHGHTAAELIYERADADKPHMGMTTWAAAPEGKIVKSDVSVAKNYLSEQEMRSLERIVSAYLDLAEDRAERHIPMTMEDWAKRLDVSTNKRRYIATFRISLNSSLMTDINPDLSSHCEIVCLLGKRKSDTTVKLSEDMDDYYRIINGKDEEL